MKKVAMAVLVLGLASISWGLGRPVINREDISLKAGPTNPGEKLSLVWVESYVYPKVVREERVVSLGVRTASKVASVRASFDFAEESVDLTSHNGMQWGGAYRIPDGAEAGLHLVRYAISGKKGSIQRTVDFFLEKDTALAHKGATAFGGEVYSSSGWPLTITSTCSALVEGLPRILYPGQSVTGISKIPWYKVIFEDGEEGWVSSSMVEEPLEETLEREAVNVSSDLIHILVDPEAEQRGEATSTVHANVASPGKGAAWYTFGGHLAASAGEWGRVEWPW